MLNPYSVNDNIYYPNIRIMMPDLYETDLVIKETAELYRYKIIEWLKNGNFDNILNMLKIENDTVKLGKSETTDENRRAKAHYIKKKFLTETGITAIIQRVKDATGLAAGEMTFNKKIVKRTIQKLFKNKLAKHLD